MKLLALLTVLMFLAFGQGCSTVSVEDEDDVIQTTHQGSRANPCVVTERDAEAGPNVCEGKLTIVESEWTTDELADIQAAMSNWNAMIGSEYFVLTAVDTAPSACHILQGERDGSILATWKREQNMIVDTTKIRASSKYTDRFQTIMQHELGHSVGLRHREGGVMCSVVPASPEFDQLDRAQCQELGLCH